MEHFPVNHRLQPVYRFVAGVGGVYLLVFGIVGLVETANVALFAQDGLPSVLGLHANRAFAILSIVAGVVLVGAAIAGGMVHQRINVMVASVFLVAGLAMMVLLETDLNFLGFSIATCIVSFVVGLVLLTAGMYGKVGPREDTAHAEATD
jgi:uncharacterized protein DUF4383